MANGWCVMYRCGCTDVRPVNDGFRDTCPTHGAEPMNSPERIADVRVRPLPERFFFRLHPGDEPVMDCCGTCDGTGRSRVFPHHGCERCSGAGVRPRVFRPDDDTAAAS